LHQECAGLYNTKHDFPEKGGRGRRGRGEGVRVATPTGVENRWRDADSFSYPTYRRCYGAGPQGWRQSSRIFEPPEKARTLRAACVPRRSGIAVGGESARTAAVRSQRGPGPRRASVTPSEYRRSVPPLGRVALLGEIADLITTHYFPVGDRSSPSSPDAVRPTPARVGDDRSPTGSSGW